MNSSLMSSNQFPFFIALQQVLRSTSRNQDYLNLDLCLLDILENSVKAILKRRFSSEPKTFDYPVGTLENQSLLRKPSLNELK